MPRRSRRFSRRWPPARGPTGSESSAIAMSASSPCSRWTKAKSVEAAGRRLNRDVSAARLRDLAEEAVGFVIEPGGEIDRVLIGGGVANPKRPEAIDGHRCAVRCREFPSEISFVEGVGVDAAVTKVSHEQVAGEIAKTCRGDGESPG